MNNLKEIKINNEFIKASQLLKLANIISQGYEAKFYIKDGLVKLNGKVISERGKKVYPNDILSISIEGAVINIKVVN